ncbi:MAG: FAD-binding oxidoreductase, partial [Bacteroidales bacterium]|nr:FAD-binding oxidoreductase [Bacteroidales bacterium]
MKKVKLKGFELDLRNRVRGDVSFDEVTLGIYATDASIYQIRPIALAIPRDEADVKAIVQTACEYNVPILPRGGGTSLGGQATGPSLIIDFSKYMNRILEVNIKDHWVRVQPGIVLDELNIVLANHNLHFAPDPATSNCATIGGMIGNNSSGTKSIFYGITRDHVMETKTLLSDGTVLHFKEHPVEEYEQNLRSTGKNSREAKLIIGLKKIIEANHDEIEKKYPKLMRRVQGYNLDSFINTDYWNLSNLMVGSEGTLGIVLEAKLNLEPLPKYKVLCTIHFDDLVESIRTVAPILKHKPSAVEILDEDVIIRARENLSIAPLCGFIEGNPKAILIVEFFGDTTEEATRKVKDLASGMQNKKLGYCWPVISDQAEQANVWAVRKNGLGLLLGVKSDRKPIPFIEDSTVPVDDLPEYIDQILQFCKKRDVPVAMYAHASVGTIHIRPFLNLKDQKDIDNMKDIAEFSFGLVKKYGGSLSGEHGDGRVRSPLLEKYFGPQIYNALREVKKLFDPAGLMNPGVIIDPNPVNQDLRYGTEYKTPTLPTEYHYREDGT